MAYFEDGYKRAFGCRDELHEYYKPYFVLYLHIRRASNVDQLNGAFSPTRNMSGYYRVIVTDSQHVRQYKTQLVKGKPEPNWGSDLAMEFDEFPKDESLFLEVLQIGSKHDPGTSSGVVVVGRARIPVPTKIRDFGWRRKELVCLQGSEKKIGGFIDLRMELKVMRLRQRDIDYMDWP